MLRGLLFVVLACSPAYAGGSKALLIGISQYADPEMNDLAYADQDVKTFASILQNFADYRKPDITMLLNEKGTKAGIAAAIVRVVKESEKEPLDRFIFMYAGHGLPPEVASNKSNAFLAPHDAYLNQFFAEGAGGLVANETFVNKAWLVNQLSSMKAKDIVIILDSCYSGAKNFGELYADNLGFRTEITAGEGSSRNIVVVRRKGADRGADQRIAFLASSRENQPSAEYAELRHGALSYTLFEYLNTVRKETEAGQSRPVTMENAYSGISDLFDKVEVRGGTLSKMHQPVLFPIPSYDEVKGMPFVAVRGIKPPERKPKPKPEPKPKPKPEPKPEPKPQPEPEPIPEPPPPPTTGEIYLDTGKDLCEVSIDGVRQDRPSNKSFEVGEGTHLVSLYLKETNYNQTVVVSVAAGDKLSLEIPMRGRLEVESRPAEPGGDAPRLEVHLDGKRLGKTPLSRDNIAAGTHELRVKVKGVIKERKIEIRPDSPLLMRYKIVVERPAAPAKQDDTGTRDVTF